MLGVNEVQELTVVTNGYTGEYGRAAGANMNITTKSGSNQFHGDAMWLWNGRALNANDYFSNASGAPRSFANSNQWAGAIGGPIKKDKLFFFYDNEGLRYVLPNSVKVFVPSPQFQAATIANLNATGQGAEVPFYQNAFKLYNSFRSSARMRRSRPRKGKSQSQGNTHRTRRRRYLWREYAVRSNLSGR
jgi:hypothetical protein